MARIARVVVPDIPHHIIQRGNRRQNVFFSDEDKWAYLKLLKQYAGEAGVSFWAWCLMDNHVHFIGVPSHERSFHHAFGETHRRYSRMINFRNGWRGYLWQGRFGSYPLSEQHLYAACRYVELNPVHAGIVRQAEDYPWSSAKAHILKIKDPLGCDGFLNDEITDWRDYLYSSEDQKMMKIVEQHARTGRPLGDETFVKKLESLTGRVLRKLKPGPKLRAVLRN